MGQLAWDYAKREVHLSMPGYVPDALNQFGHELPRRRQDSPYPHTPPNFGAKQKFVDTSDDSPVLDAAGKRFIQQVNGKFLFLGRAVENTILVALISLAAQQAAPTEVTRKRAKQLLDYVATQEEAIITYRASDMGEVVMTSVEGLLDVLVEGERKRSMGATGMNHQSSRSHSILRITVKRTSNGTATESMLNLVDLAGSESDRYTGYTWKHRKQQSEGVMINVSLLALSNVITSLGENANHVTYRESKLTQMLQPSLLGGAKVAIIYCATLAEAYFI
ncbi:MAG: hypothetical protein GY874_18515 [Desulfobacteraceae bacterium]|nr:hypothetical protein [Desulfobacteraceae bacterium]